LELEFFATLFFSWKLLSRQLPQVPLRFHPGSLALEHESQASQKGESGLDEDQTQEAHEDI